MKPRTVHAWPAACNLSISGEYLSVAPTTVKDYVAAGLIKTVELPGNTLRDKGGGIISRAGSRKMRKIFIMLSELDRFLEQIRTEEDRA